MEGRLRQSPYILGTIIYFNQIIGEICKSNCLLMGSIVRQKALNSKQFKPSELFFSQSVNKSGRCTKNIKKLI